MASATSSSPEQAALRRLSFENLSEVHDADMVFALTLAFVVAACTGSGDDSTASATLER